MILKITRKFTVLVLENNMKNIIIVLIVFFTIIAEVKQERMSRASDFIIKNSI